MLYFWIKFLFCFIRLLIIVLNWFGWNKTNLLEFKTLVFLVSWNMITAGPKADGGCWSPKALKAPIKWRLKACEAPPRNVYISLCKRSDLVRYMTISDMANTYKWFWLTTALYKAISSFNITFSSILVLWFSCFVTPNNPSVSKHKTRLTESYAAQTPRVQECCSSDVLNT